MPAMMQDATTGYGSILSRFHNARAKVNSTSPGQLREERAAAIDAADAILGCE